MVDCSLNTLVISILFMPDVKVENSELYLFSFLFPIFIFLFLEHGVRVRVTRSHCHKSVTSDDIVTVMVTGYMMHGKM